jgi:hypothetical protein
MALPAVGVAMQMILSDRPEGGPVRSMGVLVEGQGRARSVLTITRMCRHRKPCAPEEKPSTTEAGPRRRPAKAARPARKGPIIRGLIFPDG